MAYAKLERDRTATDLVAKVITFRYVAEKYMVDVVPTKGTATQADNKREMKNLIAFFDDPPAPLETIEPLHVRQYLTWRKAAPVRANREKALLSAIWNYAGQGLHVTRQSLRGHKGQQRERPRHLRRRRIVQTSARQGGCGAPRRNGPRLSNWSTRNGHAADG
jgi:hypothetical protein